MTRKTMRDLKKCYREDLKHAVETGNVEQYKIITNCLKELRRKEGK